MKRLLLVLLFAAALALPSPAWPQDEVEELRSFIADRMSALEIVETEEQALLESINAKLDEIHSDIDAYRKAYQQVIFAQGVVGPSPIVVREIYSSLIALDKGLRDAIGSLYDLRNQAEGRVENLNISASEIDYEAVGKLPEELARSFGNYLARLRKLKRALQVQSSRIEKELTSAGKLAGRTSVLVERMQKTLPAQWENFFFARKDALFSQEFWKRSLPFNNWLSLRLPVWKLRLLRASEKGVSLALNFGASLVLLTGLGWLVRRHIDPEHTYRTEMRRLARAWVVSSVGLSVYLTEHRVLPEAVGFLNIVGTSLFSFGAMQGGYIIRRAFAGYTKPSRIPLLWLFVLGGMILVSGIPEQLAAPLWLVAALALVAGMKRRFAAVPGGLVLHPWFWCLLLLMLVAASGYGRLAAFGGVICFLGHLTYTLGMAGMRFIAHCAARLPEKGLYPFVRALTLGLSSPLIWTLALGLPAYWVYDFLGEGVFRAAAGIELGWKGFTLKILSVVIVIALFFLTRAGITVTRASIERIGMGWPRAKRGTVPSLQTITAYLLWALFAVLTLNILGVDLTSLTVIAGGLSVGIGFGMQTIINNFVSGLILLFGRSLQQGDIIQLGDLWCTVKKINIRTTVVETFENASIMIPNSDLVTTQMTNWTKNNPTLRRDVAVGVAYGSNTELVRSTLLEVAAAHPHVLSKPAPWVMFSDFGASSLDFILRVWIEDIDYALSTISDLRFEIDKAFRERGIEIAFPQMDLHIRSAEGLKRLG